MSLEEEEGANQPQKNVVKLISKEGDEFIVDRDCVMASGTIRAMLTGPGMWKETTTAIPEIQFESITTSILERVIQYFYYKKRFDHTNPPLPPFKLDTDHIIKLLLAANFLDC